jgi:hypothetical protein
VGGLRSASDSRRTTPVLQILEFASDLRKPQRMRMPEMAREMTRRWISLVPSKMV